MKLKIVRDFICVICASLIICTKGHSDSLNYVSPVDHTIRLAGNFMEIRGNHFHAGIDIKSEKGKIGDAIYAIGDGHISRIKVQSGGYGNVIYIDHPEGYTSVYAHLDKFSNAVESYVKNIQYALERFEVDIYLPDSLFLVSRKEQIGEMGVTGRSFGPHLHFELRKTTSENPVNPEVFGIGPKDTRAPILESLTFYSLDENSSVIEESTRYFNPNKKGYQLYDNIIEVNSHKVGLGIQMFDRMDGSSNKNGVYGYRLFVDDRLHFSWQANEFSFNEDVLLKGFIDYKKHVATSRKIYLLYRQMCNHFSYFEGESDGTIHLEGNDPKEVRIEAYDLYGNVSETQFKIRNNSTSAADNKSTIPCDTSHHYKGRFFDIEMEDNTLFSSEGIHIVETEELIDGQRCPVVSIADHFTAVKKYYKVSVNSSKITNFKNLTLAGFNKAGRMVHYGIEQSDSSYFSMVNKCGDFFLYRDVEKPDIKILHLGRDQTRPWKIKITDNLIPAGRVNDLDYRVTVNGEWVRMQYDKKTDMLYFNDFERLTEDPLNIVIKLRDYCGNEDTVYRVLN